MHGLMAWLPVFTSGVSRRRSGSSQIYEPIEDLLAEHAKKLLPRLSACAKSLLLQNETDPERSRAPGVDPRLGDYEPWEMIVIYLLVGSDNFLRAAPDCVHLMWTAVVCDKLYGPTVTPLAGEATPSSSAASYLRTDNMRSLLRSLSTGAYELLRFGGGKLGNRVPEVLHEKAMNFDDLNELCSVDGAQGLFLGLDEMCNTLFEQTEEMLEWAIKEGETLACYEGSKLQEVHSHLQETYRIWSAHQGLDPKAATMRLKHGSVFSSPETSSRLETSALNSGAAPLLAANANDHEDDAGADRGASVLERVRQKQEEVLQKHFTKLRLPLRSRAPTLQGLFERAVKMECIVLDEAGLSEGLGALNISTDTQNAAERVLAHARALRVEHWRGLAWERLERRPEDGKEVEAPALSKAIVEGDATFTFEELVVFGRVVNAHLQHTGAYVQAGEAYYAPRTRFHEALHQHQQELRGNGSLFELKSLFERTQKLYENTTMRACVLAVTKPMRFTWNTNGHKTFTERPGYHIIVYETWFLWQSFLLFTLTIANYTSGGYVGWYASVLFGMLWEASPKGVVLQFASSIDNFANTTLAPTFKAIVGAGEAGNWLAYYAFLAFAYQLLEAIHELLHLFMAMYIDTRAQQIYWGRSRRVWQLLSSGIHIKQLPLICRWCCCLGRSQAPRSPRTPRRVLSQDDIDAMASINTTGRTRPHVEKDSQTRCTTCRGWCRSFADRVSMLLWPLQMLVGVLASIFTAMVLSCSFVCVCCGNSALRIQWRKFCPSLLRLLLRTVAIYLYAISYGAALQSQDTSAALKMRSLYLFLTFVQGSWHVLTSIAQAVLSFNYSFRPLHLQRFSPKDQRPMHRIMMTSLFWVAVFGLKLLWAVQQIEYAARTGRTGAGQWVGLEVGGEAWLKGFGLFTYCVS